MSASPANVPVAIKLRKRTTQRIRFPITGRSIAAVSRRLPQKSARADWGKTPRLASSRITQARTSGEAVHRACKSPAGRERGEKVGDMDYAAVGMTVKRFAQRLPKDNVLRQWAEEF